jgi:hypothetical protein
MAKLHMNERICYVLSERISELTSMIGVNREKII